MYNQNNYSADSASGLWDHIMRSRWDRGKQGQPQQPAPQQQPPILSGMPLVSGSERPGQYNPTPTPVPTGMNPMPTPMPTGMQSLSAPEMQTMQPPQMGGGMQQLQPPSFQDLQPPGFMQENMYNPYSFQTYPMQSSGGYGYPQQQYGTGVAQTSFDRGGQMPLTGINLLRSLFGGGNV